MIKLESHADGVILPIRAHAGARQNAVLGEREGSLRVAVTAAPEKGKANSAIIALLSKELGVSKSSVELIAGDTSPQKRFLIHGATLPSLAATVNELINE